MTTPSHDPTEPPCPWWCVNREYAGTPDHGTRHEGHPLAVDAERPDSTLPVDLHLLLVMAVGGSVARILLGAGDEDYVTVTSAAGRSLAAGLVRLADVLEGLVSL